MNWQPKDILNLVALIGAFVLFAVGAVMVWHGVSAEGTIDIKSSLVSGSLKTGSAGLFMVFLAFLLAAFSLLSINGESKQNKAPTIERRTRSARLAKGFFALVAGSAICTALASAGFGVGFGLLAGALAFFAMFAGFAYLTFLENE